MSMQNTLIFSINNFVFIISGTLVRSALRVLNGLRLTSMILFGLLNIHCIWRKTIVLLKQQLKGYHDKDNVEFFINLIFQVC